MTWYSSRIGFLSVSFCVCIYMYVYSALLKFLFWSTVDICIHCQLRVSCCRSFSYLFVFSWNVGAYCYWWCALRHGWHWRTLHLNQNNLWKEWWYYFPGWSVNGFGPTGEIYHNVCDHILSCNLAIIKLEVLNLHSLLYYHSLW